MFVLTRAAATTWLALRAVGNIATADDMPTQSVLDAGALPRLVPLLEHEKKSIRKDACWTLSNIAAGNCAQIQCVLDGGFLTKLRRILIDSSDVSAQKEAAWTIANVITGGRTAQICAIVDADFVAPLCDVATTRNLEPRTVTVVLSALEGILKEGVASKDLEASAAAQPTEQAFGAVFEASGAREKLEKLRFHQDSDVVAKAETICGSGGLLEALFLNC